jgi:hypothetical protein
MSEQEAGSEGAAVGTKKASTGKQAAVGTEKASTGKQAAVRTEKASTGKQAAVGTVSAVEPSADKGRAKKPGEVDWQPAGASTAAAVSPKWSGTRSKKPGVQRATAILFGLAAVLALVVLAIWLRSRPRKPKQQSQRPPVVERDNIIAPMSEPDAGAKAGGTKRLNPSTERPTNPSTERSTNPAATSTPPGATPVTPVTPGTPAAAPPATGEAKPATTSTPPGATPVTPVTPGTPAAAPPATGEAKPDPGKEAKALLVKSKKALAESNAEAALLYADQALELKRSARAHLARAQALHAMGRTEDALAAIDRSIAMSDDFAEGWLNRGRALDMLKRTGEARAAFARYLELQPTGATADEIRKRLAQ